MKESAQRSSGISFIIPVFNASSTIAEAVTSIMEGNFESGDEIIIVNDASTDNSLQIAQDLKEKYPESIVIVSHAINKGSAAAGRNTGIDISRNDSIFCLDADNILAPHSVHSLKKYMDEQEAGAAAFRELRYFTQDPSAPTHSWLYKEREITLSDALAGAYWPGPSGNYLFTKDSWRRAGRQNESVGGAHDSWAFGIQQLATGTKMVIQDKSFYLHRYGYESTFVRENAKANSSLVALSVLTRYLHLIDPADVEYILSKEHRYTWFSELDKRPLRVAGSTPGKNGTSDMKPPTVMERVKMKFRSLFEFRAH